MVAYHAAMARPRPVDALTDLGLLAAVVAGGMAGRIRDALADAGYDDVRDSHGYVVQGLLAGDTTVTALADRLGISPQAVSKSVSELERRGYVRRGRDHDDGRARPLRLTTRGEAMVDASRRARRAAARDLGRWLGTRDEAELVRLLQHAAERFGSTDELSTRRLRPPT
jgi:DNA-binding MarR family transcriptional regulator